MHEAIDISSVKRIIKQTPNADIAWDFCGKVQHMVNVVLKHTLALYGMLA